MKEEGLIVDGYDLKKRIAWGRYVKPKKDWCDVVGIRRAG